MPQEVRCPENPGLPDVCGGPATVSHVYQMDGTYTAILWQFDARGSVTDANRTALGREIIRVGERACTKEYRPVCGAKPIVCITTPCEPMQETYSNRCLLDADGAAFLYEGQCRVDVDPSLDRRCKSWYDGCNTCSREKPDSPAMCTLRACTTTGPKYCTAYFDTASGNKSPSISSLSGPPTLEVGQAGTWTIQASDPENSVLTYRVTWGDETLGISPYQSLAVPGSVVQTTTFTHSYAQPGTYTVLIVAIDAAGNEARSSTTVQVGQTSVACTLEYAPVCGQPARPLCLDTPPYCKMAEPGPQTYSNRCFMNAAGATFLYDGGCSTTPTPVPIACTADAFPCPNGVWVGRTGPKCEFVCPATAASAQCITPWGNIPVAHNATIAQEPYFTNGQYSPTLVLKPLMRCNNGNWLKCDHQGNNCVLN
jgi:hypothetical protein